MRRLVPLIVAVTVAFGPGCGGGDEGSGRSATVASGAELKVVGDEYFFDPERVTVRPGGRFDVALENRGVLAHNLRVFAGGREVGGTPTFTGGKTRRASLTLEPGEYELVCTVGNHAELGMTGTLTVE